MAKSKSTFDAQEENRHELETTGNFIPELVSYLDADISDPEVPSIIICQICQSQRLTISPLARSLAVSEGGLRGCTEPRDLLQVLYAHGFERTVVFPCGHVFGDRCVRDIFVEQSGLACPSCGYKMAYRNCGHAIAPAVIPVQYADSIRHTFPLTIPEGGAEPVNCKECRWEVLRARLRYAFGTECAICARNDGAVELKEHEAHRIRHIEFGIKEAISQIMMLAQPEFITRESTAAHEKAVEEKDVREVNAALLHAMVMTELESTIWQRAGTNQLTKEQARRHSLEVQAMESWILGLLMNPGDNNLRRMW
ncbi:hypothetical protein GGS20DRAFT_149443 [Poronia punctata]|nr:hypothetical protein GGS20DRAFT_149443 [Poronia punctata]